MTNEPFVVALDIGGANLKLADSRQRIVSVAFPLWKEWQRLPAHLSTLLGGSAEKSAPDRIVATMTGELADCYRNKREGVTHIVRSLEEACETDQLQIYLTDGRFVSASQARVEYALAAASNWHALASFVAMQESWQTSVLVDIGSTTCDVIPIQDGQVVAQGTTDTERLLTRELIYIGAERTSIPNVVSELPYRGQLCPIARERFATMLDVNLILEKTSSRPDDHDTADGRVATRELAVERLGRCICADEDTWSHEDAIQAAEYVFRAAVQLLDAALFEVASRHAMQGAPLVLSGHGDFMLSSETLSNWARVDHLSELIGVEASRCAPAHALLKLATQ